MIIRYNKDSFEKVENYLIEYNNTSDYRFLFSSKEWIHAYIEVFKPSDSFLIFSKSYHNYFSLSLNQEAFVFTGSPFNDFNGFLIRQKSESFDFREIYTRLSNIHARFLWEELFEKKQVECLLTASLNGHALNESSVAMKVTRSNKPFDLIISKRIIKNYNKFAKDVCFNSIDGKAMSEQKHLLQKLFEYRQTKLSSLKSGKNSPSVGSSFTQFIEKLVYTESMSNNVILDYCVDRQTNEYLAFSLSFVKDNKKICYLRSHAPSQNHVSFGLILDYWGISTNFQGGIDTVDLTRGNESYKSRLGATEYFLDNFVCF
jgi:CelD/BcsL family acetyltransferase involved in cellulose biosynthesis